MDTVPYYFLKASNLPNKAVIARRHDEAICQVLAGFLLKTWQIASFRCTPLLMTACFLIAFSGLKKNSTVQYKMETRLTFMQE